MLENVEMFLQGPSYSQFCPKIRCHGNGGWQGKNLNNTVKLADLQKSYPKTKNYDFILYVDGVMTV